jgi:quinol-cytochrome oxidoreductase complex cytochrome b subunit
MPSVSKHKRTVSRKSPLDLLAHLHPPTVARETLRFTLSWGLGGMALVLLLLLVTSGILQLFIYTPTVEGAYASVTALYSGGFGGWIRNIHHWSSNLLIVIAWLHLLRVYLTGANGPGRRLNWIVGHLMLLLILFANFSGYLLPWDQLGYWAVTISTNMMTYIPVVGPALAQFFRGGPEVGAATLATFYTFHISLLPALLIMLACYHFWLVRKAGGLIRAESPAEKDEHRPDKDKRIATVPHLIVREAAVAFALIAAVVVTAALLNAPIQEAAHPGMSPNPAKAPWYFLGFQELLMHLHPIFAITVLPALLLVFLFAFPFFPGTTLKPGQWFGGKRGPKLASWATLAGLISAFCLAGVDDLVRNRAAASPGIDIVTRGYLPTALYLLSMTVLYLAVKKKGGYSRAESLMAVALFSSGMLVALTITGIYFRGPGMQLIIY